MFWAIQNAKYPKFSGALSLDLNAEGLQPPPETPQLYNGFYPLYAY